MLQDEVTALSAASADETTSSAIALNGFDRLGWAVIASAGVSAGVVEIEWADSFDYAGTWKQIDAITLTTASIVDGSSVDFIGGFVRARISTAISGGTVTVKLRRSVVGLY